MLHRAGMCCLEEFEIFLQNNVSILIFFSKNPSFWHILSEANSYADTSCKFFFLLLSAWEYKWVMLLVTAPLDRTEMGWTSVAGIEGKQEYVMRLKLGKPRVSLTGLKERQKGVSWWILVEGSYWGVERFSWASVAQWVRATGLFPSRLSSRFLKTVLFHSHHLLYKYIWKSFLYHLKWWYIAHLTCKGISPFFTPALQGSSTNKCSHICWSIYLRKTFPSPALLGIDRAAN